MTTITFFVSPVIFYKLVPAATTSYLTSLIAGLITLLTEIVVMNFCALGEVDVVSFDPSIVPTRTKTRK